MLGRRYEWIGEPPLYWTVIFWIMMGEFVVSCVLFFTLPRWAPTTPDPSHPIEVRMKGGHSYYFSPKIHWFVNNDFWIFFGLPGIQALIMFLHRDGVQRV